MVTLPAAGASSRQSPCCTPGLAQGKKHPRHLDAQHGATSNTTPWVVVHAGMRRFTEQHPRMARSLRGAELTTAFPHARPKLQRRSDERLILLAKFVDRGACLAWHSRPSKTKDLEVRNRHRQLSIRNNCPHLSQLCLQCLNPCLLLAANTFRLLQLRYSNSDTLASTRPSAGDAERWVLSRSVTCATLPE